MEDNLPVPISQTDVSSNDSPKFYIQRRRKTRKKLKKHNVFKRLLRLVCICLIVFILFKNHSVIFSFLENTVFDLTSSDNLNTGQSNHSNSDTVDNDYSNNENHENVIFIDTSPNKFEIRNETNIDLNANYNDAKFIKNSDVSSGEPFILIVNFSPYESYRDSGGFYAESDNVYKIGEEICHMLNKNGLTALHMWAGDKFPSLHENKMSFYSEISNVLKEYPSISYIIDISRDLDVNDNDSINRETVCTTGIFYPTIKLFCGTDNGDASENQLLGIDFSRLLADRINSYVPLLASSLTVSKYSLHLNLPCIAIRADIGSYPCSFDDTLGTAEIFCTALSELIK